MESGWVAALVLVLELGVRIGVVVWIVVRSARRPSTTIAWILLVAALPVFGALLYLLVGEVRLGQKRVRHHAEIANRIHAAAAPFWESMREEQFPKAYAGPVRLASAVGGFSPRSGNLLTLHGDTDQCIDALVTDIERAKHHCHLLFFIYLDDPTGKRVANALEQAAQRGVSCRLLVDAVGSRPFLRCDTREQIEKSGVQVRAALPANLFRAAFARLDLRNHRKIAVIDGAIGYTGSQNIADASFAPKPKYAPWVDAMLRIEGPVVRDLQELFVTDWYQDSGESLEDLLSIEPPFHPDEGVAVQVIPTGPDCYVDAIQQINHAACHLAEEELILTTPYFVPAEADVASLCTAARRGVEVTIVVPRRNDHILVAAASRSFYPALLESGVRIHEYTKGLLHSKTMTADRGIAMVSTANFDRRSFSLNFEVTSLVYDANFASQLRFLQHSYMADSIEIDASSQAKLHWSRRLGRNAAGLLGPLL